MIHMLMALHAEAAPVIRALSLSASSGPGPFRSWTRSGLPLTLTLSGPGIYAASACTSALLSASADPSGDLIISLGSCASLDPERFPAGQLYRANALHDMASRFRYYPDMIFRTVLPEAPLLTGGCVLNAENRESIRSCMASGLYDMESAAVCAAARFYLGPHQMLFLRYATDTGESLPSAEAVSEESARHLPVLLPILHSCLSFHEALREENRTGNPEVSEDLVRDLRCSESMRLQLRQMALYARLTCFPWDRMTAGLYHEGLLPAPGRKEGKDILARIRKQLYC